MNVFLDRSYDKHSPVILLLRRPWHWPTKCDLDPYHYEMHEQAGSVHENFGVHGIALVIIIVKIYI